MFPDFGGFKAEFQLAVIGALLGLLYYFAAIFWCIYTCPHNFQYFET